MSKVNKRHKVSIFGENFDEEAFQKKHDGPSAVFGVLLLFSGIMLLLNTFSVIPWEIWNNLLPFWPLVLVLGGVQIVLGGSWISRLIVLVLSIYLFGSAVLFVLKSQKPDIFNIFPTEVKNTVTIWEVMKK